jgi:hypothetical protein
MPSTLLGLQMSMLSTSMAVGQLSMTVWRFSMGELRLFLELLGCKLILIPDKPIPGVMLDLMLLKHRRGKVHGTSHSFSLKELSIIVRGPALGSLPFE